MHRRRTIQLFLSILALFLLGTVLLLGSISIYLNIDIQAYISDLPSNERNDLERIPRIIHQTWKSDIIPEKWKDISLQCRQLMPDYEYILWTDDSSREFIAKQYPWFLDTFDAYTYPIQRADAIRYFILYHYGGVYLDLDVGCRRPLDPLLVYSVVLPRTIPVGISNDIMFAEKGHPFMAQTIHNLVTFDHTWILNYPTVMFSTGPMFLSAQYGIWTSSHHPTPDQPGGEVRILPKSLYGKNVKPEEAPNSFFSHYYGSSWHADDAAFVSFLGKWGKGLMWIGLVVLVIGSFRLLWQSHSKRRERGSTTAARGFEVLLPRSYQRNGRWHVDLSRYYTVVAGSSDQSPPSSPSSTSSEPSSACLDEVDVLPLSFHSRSSTPNSIETLPNESSIERSRSISAMDAIYRAGSQVMAYIPGIRSSSVIGQQRNNSRRSWHNRGVLFYLPAIFTAANPTPVFELDPRRTSSRRISSRTRSASSHHRYEHDKLSLSTTSNYLPVYRTSSRTRTPSPHRGSPASVMHSSYDCHSTEPPPYPSNDDTRKNGTWDIEHGWEEWSSR